MKKWSLQVKSLKPSVYPAIALGQAWAISLIGHAAVLLVLGALLVAGNDPANRASLAFQASVNKDRLQDQDEKVDDSPTFLLAGAPSDNTALSSQWSGGDAPAFLTTSSFATRIAGESVTDDAGGGGGGELDLASLDEDLEPGKNNDGTSTFCGIKAKGYKFVYVVDISGSMHGERFQRAIRELRQSIDQLCYDQRYYIVFFNGNSYPMPGEELMEPTRENLKKTWNWVSNAAPNGSTHPLDSLLTAVDFKPDAVFLLSDGQFDPLTGHQLQALRPETRVPVHTVGFESREGEPMLMDISQKTGGIYRFVR